MNGSKKGNLGTLSLKEQKMAKFLFVPLFLGVIVSTSATPINAVDAYKKGDYENAFVEWLKFADLGFAKAQYYVGIMYINGQGTKSLPKVGARYIKMASLNGYAPAQQVFGMLYFHGKGVSKDLVQAYTWLALAVIQGRTEAGIERDKVWWNLSTNQIATARLELAELVANERTGLGDDKKAAEIIKDLAETGHAEAQLRLSKLFFKGRGVPLDIIESYKWHTLSAFRGNLEAQATDTALRSHMTQKQIDEAAFRASVWIPCRQKNRKC